MPAWTEDLFQFAFVPDIDYFEKSFFAESLNAKVAPRHFPHAGRRRSNCVQRLVMP
jgi:hypothetical protein